MSGSNKFSRGGGRGFNRTTPLSGRGMMPLGRGGNSLKDRGKAEEMGAKGRGLAHSYGIGGGGGAAAGSFLQEKFDLFSCKDQDTFSKFAMAIRLTPGLLETMRKAEELGEATSIKFGPGASNNVIRIGGEEFTFSAAIEPGHLCDVYEEEKRGQDGNGRLVESGAVWRKLAVTRTLNEKDKNRVKQRSEEAERQQKSRQVLIVDPTNLTNKSTTAADANGRRAPIIKSKNMPPKKKTKTTGPPPVIPPPSALRQRQGQGQGAAERPPAPLSVNKASAKPAVASSPDRFVPSRSAASGQGVSVASSNLKVSASREEVVVLGASKSVAAHHKDKASSPARAAGVESGAASKASGPVNTFELRNCLITLLTDNPKGMTIKALEKAVGEALSSVRPDKKQIEKVIKSIANYRAPGKYMLKHGVEKGTFTKPSPGSGSSLDSPPLGESTARIGSFQEAQEALGNAESPADAIVVPRQDAKKVGGHNRGSVPSVRKSSGDAVSRAIEKVDDIIRKNVNRSQPFGQLPFHASPSESHQPEDLKESGELPEMADGEVSIGADDSPSSVLPEKSPQELEVQNDNHSFQTHNISASREGNASDASDSSSDSASSSSSGSDSESESASGSGSESDSDASSSGSGSEEDNGEEDVKIMSEDEDKVAADVDAADVSRQKLKLKENKSSLERLDSRNQRQAPLRGDGNEWLQTSKDAAGLYGVDEIGAVGGDMDNDNDGVVVKDTVDANTDEEDVDVVSCDDATSQQHFENGANRPRGPVEDSVTDVVPLVGDKGFVQDSLRASIPRKAGSESDHSIEEYERRAANDVFRAPGVKAPGEPPGQGHEAQKERSDRTTSPRSRVCSGTAVIETAPGTSRQQRETASLKTLPTETFEGLSSGMKRAPAQTDRASLKTSSSTDRSQTGALSVPKTATSEMLSGRQSGEPPPKGKPAAELKRKEPKSTIRGRKIAVAVDTQGKGAAGSRIFQPPNKGVDAQGKRTKSSVLAAGEIPFTSREEPGVLGEVPETMDSMTVDQIVKSGPEGDGAERKNLSKKQYREGITTLDKPLGAVAWPKEGEKSIQTPGQYRGPDVPGKGGRTTKQGRRQGLKRNDVSERWPGPLPEEALNIIETVDLPAKRSSSEGEQVPLSRKSNGNGACNPKQNDMLNPDADRPDATSFNLSVASLRAKGAGVSDELEQGELRDMVAGADLKIKDSARSDLLKGSPELRFLHSNKTRGSLETEKPRNEGKLGDVQKRSTGEFKKKQRQQQRSKNSTLQKVEVQCSLPEVMPVTAQRPGGGSEDRFECSGGHALDTGSKPRSSLGDHQEKGVDGSRTQKRQADDAGEYGFGRLPKRVAVDSHQSTPLIRGGEGESISLKQERLTFESEGNRKNSAMVVSMQWTLSDGAPTISRKAATENGRFTTQKSKRNDAPEIESTDRRPEPLAGKQGAGHPGPGSKKESPCNGQIKTLTTGNAEEFFASYEKRAPELKGPISCHSQYMEYREEFLAKYDVYVNLHAILDRDKNDFLNYKREINNAKAREDKIQLGKIYGDLRTNYLLCRKRFKRMQLTFGVLHRELSDLKQRCKEYAELRGSR